MHDLSLLDDPGAVAPIAFAPPPLVARRPAQLVGNTPLLWIDQPFAQPGKGFFAKLEGRNPGGIKDRPALHMIRQARGRGDLLPGAPIVESSSGTLGLGLALAGQTYGHPVTVVTDPGMEPAVVRLLGSSARRSTRSRFRILAVDGRRPGGNGSRNCWLPGRGRTAPISTPIRTTWWPTGRWPES